MPEIKAPTNLILFGFTGDLVQKKVIPSLFHLYKEGRLPELFNVVGFSRRTLTVDEVQEIIFTSLENHPDLGKNARPQDMIAFAKKFQYISGDFVDQSSYTAMGNILGRVDESWSTCSNKLFHLAVPPKYYKEIFLQLKKSNLTKPCGADEGWTRVIVEKPFGRDLKTAKELDMLLGKLFKEEQIYRIDHYLGKEMMENILMFRFANNLLEPVWNSKHIEKIEVEVLEKTDIGSRGVFYDEVGALRDIGQNHLLQMLALVLMENPYKNGPRESLRTKRAKLLKELSKTKVNPNKNSYRGQYTGYTKTEGVDKQSFTETYFLLKTQVSNQTWQEMPIYIECGKSMEQTNKKIKVTFKPLNSFGHHNRLTIDLDGDDAGIYIDLWAKKPGLGLVPEKRTLSFSLCDNRDECTNNSEEYESLIYDCLEGNQMRFLTTDELQYMWKVVDPVLKSWQKQKHNGLKLYKKGTEQIRQDARARVGI
ncbi:glucose-6-phosphate dehydrogenase [Candidatus Nomurabacteria bacterium]|uniref:Glucose-6-phosphate dehydrogenase n=1 Tax=candidate division WWE3 bacterium TaxID=2053526 RepID=A0A955E0Z8_UNCKA|nr:glucose-6-phosphate dehydrogenase [candidate division WWE3 bacterium]MCB9823449.1 glucose-6-phosphate dehydrogenase [Candidatus Nomurabacteria bacterium]MCB9827731.1 glucose-6-phosphate dehydrogenase [Candidatus Nomurabacteria bacterium]HXK52771.1 glucose-6-phosphate dehydrogenase [bacterium]